MSEVDELYTDDELGGRELLKDFKACVIVREWEVSRKGTSGAEHMIVFRIDGTGL